MSQNPQSIPPMSVPATPTLTTTARSKIRTHYSLLSGWKKLLLSLSLVLAVIGSSGSLFGLVREKAPETVAAKATIESIKSAAVAGKSLSPDQQAQLDQAKAKAQAAGHWFYEKTAPHLAKIGVGFFVAFILGYIFRQFIKTMTSLAAIALVCAGAAAYFGWIDFGHFRDNLGTSTGWIMDQLGGVKEMILKFIGASLSGTVGFFIGFMRR